MFRSIADQVEGSQGSHWQYRERVVAHIEQQRESFEPFLEDDEKFDAYVARMRRDGEWGGHQELFAASQLLRRPFVIHQHIAPRFEIRGGEGGGPALHLSYHGEQHYNSVRASNDPAMPNTPPRPIALNLANAEQQRGGGGVDGNVGAGSVSAAERLVSLSVPSASVAQVKATLADVEGDAESAIELLVAGYVSPDSGEGEEAGGGEVHHDEVEDGEGSQRRNAAEAESSKVGEMAAAVVSSSPLALDRVEGGASQDRLGGGRSKDDDHIDEEEAAYLAAAIEAIAVVEAADASAAGNSSSSSNSENGSSGGGGSSSHLKEKASTNAPKKQVGVAAPPSGHVSGPSSKRTREVKNHCRSELCPCGSRKKYKKCCMKPDKRKQKGTPEDSNQGGLSAAERMLVGEFGAILI
jgi:OTU domain-containing protein 3